MFAFITAIPAGRVRSSGATFACALMMFVGLAICTEASTNNPVEREIDWGKAQQFWSFQVPQRHTPPAVKAKRWPRQPMDYFILARLESSGSKPASEAARRTLIRRVTFDLTGLPPTPEEVASFVSDRRADAYERLVEHLLGSARFGERMASLWLPLARYAEDQAHQVGTDTKYFYPNAWRYREWVINAFNRDLPYDAFLQLQLAADKIEGTNSPNLAALGFLGLGPKYYDRDQLAVKADEWEDRVDTVSRAMLGLTVACARCHDHKFDPITSGDYYAMAGVFASTRMVNRRPDGALEKNDAQITNISPATLHVVLDNDKPEDLPVFLRGNVDRKGPVAPRQFLRVLSGKEPALFHEGSGRRELAGKIASRTNPLTARVMVNRVWGILLGQPLVATPSNFGHSGMAPSHPELLDDLTVRFVEGGWSVKALARELVLSATYRQDSRIGSRQVAAATGGDSLDVPFARMPRRRLSVEQWRDAVLSASGELDLRGGPSLELDDPRNLHRTVHARVSRLKLNDLLMHFDYPDANVHAEKRNVTTTAMQKLFVLNSPFMQERARMLAQRLQTGSALRDEARIQHVHQLLFAREPVRAETKLALEFLRKPATGAMSRWEQYAQLLLASNEMMYVD